MGAETILAIIPESLFSMDLQKKCFFLFFFVLENLFSLLEQTYMFGLNPVFPYFDWYSIIPDPFKHHLVVSVG